MARPCPATAPNDLHHLRAEHLQAVDLLDNDLHVSDLHFEDLLVEFEFASAQLSSPA